MTMRSFVVLVMMIALVVAMRSETSVSNKSNNPNNSKKQAAAVTPVTVNANGQSVLDIIPDGTSMAYDDFKQQAGPNVASLLAWATPKTVTRKGSQLSIDCAAPASTVTNGITIDVASRVEFDVDTTMAGLAAKNIVGVKVTSGSIGPFPIKKATMTVEPSGNIKIKGSVELSRWLPYWNFEITLDSNGQPIP